MKKNLGNDLNCTRTFHWSFIVPYNFLSCVYLRIILDYLYQPEINSSTVNVTPKISETIDNQIRGINMQRRASASANANVAREGKKKKNA